MDKLEKLFIENREAFEEEPLEGHFERFETKLEQYNPVKKRKFKAWPFLKIASVLIIVLLISNLLIYVIPGKKTNDVRQFANSERIVR